MFSLNKNFVQIFLAFRQNKKIYFAQILKNHIFSTASKRSNNLAIFK